MSNLGLEVALREQGIEFKRAQVGDRYVLAMLRETGGSLGGESSGHILLLDKTTTGDALMAGLQVLAVMRETGQSLAELAAGMPRFPQTMINVKVARRFDPKTVPEVEETVQRVDAAPRRRRPGGPAALRHRTGHPRDGRGPRRDRYRALRRGNRRRGPPRCVLRDAPLSSRPFFERPKRQQRLQTCAARSSQAIGKCTARARKTPRWSSRSCTSCRTRPRKSGSARLSSISPN